MTSDIGNKTKGSREWGRKARKQESRAQKASRRRDALRDEADTIEGFGDYFGNRKWGFLNSKRKVLRKGNS